MSAPTIVLVLLAGTPTPACALPPEAAEALARAAEADTRLRVAGTCADADLGLLRQAIAALEPCVAGAAPALEKPRWRFPVRGAVPTVSIGGKRGEGYRPAHRKRCFAIKDPGHPAHDLFVTDPDQNSRDERGDPFVVEAVEDGIVLVVHRGWTPRDEGKGGNYVMEWLPSRKAVAYYAHLEEVEVRAGDRVERGQRLGTIGRTGKNAYPARSPTHLHFALWDAASFVPIDPYRWLVASETSRGDLVKD